MPILFETVADQQHQTVVAEGVVAQVQRFQTLVDRLRLFESFYVHWKMSETDRRRSKVEHLH